MNMQDKAEHAVMSANEYNSEFDESVPEHKQNSIDFLIVTKIPQNAYKFQWIIRQFSKISENKALYSSDIYVEAKFCYQLKLTKYEHGFGLFHVKKTNDSCESISTCFGCLVMPDEDTEVENTNEFSIMLEYQVYATNSKGKELMAWSACFSNDSSSYNIGEYINNAVKHFPDDSLILNCNLNVILMPTTEKIPIAFKPSLKSKSWEKLSMDLKALHQSSKETDVTLVVGTDKIHAHKIILTARSTVFSKIFHHDMKEAEQNSVAISDVKFSALQRLVEFLYTGILADDENKDMDLQDLFDLYYAADKYEVMDLREMVGNTLLGRAQMDNVSKILVWADRHNNNDLKSRIMNFIKQNFEVVFNTDAWESCSLHHTRLAVEVFNFCVKQTHVNSTVMGKKFE